MLVLRVLPEASLRRIESGKTSTTMVSERGGLSNMQKTIRISYPFNVTAVLQVPSLSSEGAALLLQASMQKRNLKMLYGRMRTLQEASSMQKRIPRRKVLQRCKGGKGEKKHHHRNH